MPAVALYRVGLTCVWIRNVALQRRRSAAQAWDDSRLAALRLRIMASADRFAPALVKDRPSPNGGTSQRQKGNDQLSS